ncbi:MAG: hypothetical protein KDC38_03480 [Planctomycetes bacterium]|nr:hypothetical protein [Planctomycetota bacterium]
MIMQKIKRLFGRREIPVEARELLRGATTPRQLLSGLDELITRNEMEVNGVNREIEALERVESTEVERIREGQLPERSKYNVLRRIQRLRKQMDNLEERQRIYNRNINLQIHLVGRIQSLEAMEMRGVDESSIDEILNTYEEELSSYQNTLETEDLLVTDLAGSLDDRSQLSEIEAEIVGIERVAEPEAVPTAPRPVDEASLDLSLPPGGERRWPASTPEPATVDSTLGGEVE